MAVFSVRAVALGVAAVALAANALAADLAPVTLDQLCVTGGAIRVGEAGGLSIDAPRARAALRSLTAPSAAIAFRYLGPSLEAGPPTSGPLTREIGLRLNALNDCNLVTVTWRIEPAASVVVAVNSHPGEATPAQCGAGGGAEVRPAVMKAAMAPGETHRLRAELYAGGLRVFADGAEVWRGALGGAAAKFSGPVGLSADNARVDFTFWAPQPDDGARRAPCPASE